MPRRDCLAFEASHSINSASSFARIHRQLIRVSSFLPSFSSFTISLFPSLTHSLASFVFSLRLVKLPPGATCFPPPPCHTNFPFHSVLRYKCTHSRCITELLPFCPTTLSFLYKSLGSTFSLPSSRQGNFTTVQYTLCVAAFHFHTRIAFQTRKRH